MHKSRVETVLPLCFFCVFIERSVDLNRKTTLKIPKITFQNHLLPQKTYFFHTFNPSLSGSFIALGAIQDDMAVRRMTCVN